MQISKTCAALVLLLVFTGTFCGVNAATKEQKDESPFLNFDAASEIDHKTIEMETALKEGRLEKALNLARQLVELSAKCYGTDHYEYARALNNFAWYEQNNGDFTGARKDFETAQRIIEKELGKDSPKLVAVLNNLATLLAAQGDAQRAAPLLERSLTLEEMVLGKDSVDLSNTLNNLAVIYDACGREQDARNVLERAFQIETKQDCDELEKTMTLTNLALMNQSEGKLEDAEKMLEEVLALRKKNKTSASDLSETLNNLAVIEISQNKLAEAEDHLNEALELLPSAAESGYIDKMPVLNNQCKLQLKKGKLELARQACIKSSQLLDRYIEDVLAGTSFAEKRQFLQSRLPAQISLLISTNTRDEEAQETYSFLAKWKGILIESMRQESRIMRLSTDTKYTADIARLLALRARFTELLHLSSKLNLNDWKQSSDEILQEKENIERKLLGVRNREQDTLSELSIPRLSSMLREDEMLVDFYSYLAEDKNAEASYAVFFLSAGKVSGIKKLGAALAINHDIDVWRKKVIARIDASAELESIRNRISPLLQAQKNRLFVIPDGDLFKMPFSLLSDHQMITQLDSPRELVYLRTSQPADGRSADLLAVGGVEFGNQKLFQPLPGTLKEVEQICALAGLSGLKYVLLKGAEPSKQKIVAQIENFKMVHLATHGFFSSEGLQRQYNLDASSLGINEHRLIQQRDPLAQSGLILASENNVSGNQNSQEQKNAQDFQILSAEEILGMDLHKCRSIVLSACETGLGEKENSQGVLGLRASVMAAGARMLLISLWKIPDDATVAFMQEFYRNLWQKKQCPAEALKSARLAVCTNPAFSSAVNWAAWVMIGEGW